MVISTKLLFEEFLVLYEELVKERKKERGSIQELNQLVQKFLYQWVDSGKVEVLIQEITNFVLKNLPPSSMAQLKLLLLKYNQQVVLSESQVSNCCKNLKISTTDDKIFELINNRNEYFQEDGILQFSTTQMAENLTLLEFDLFEKISATEFLSYHSNALLAPHLVLFINHFNAVTQWVSSEIIAAADIMKKISVLKKFINIGKKLYQCKNYNGAMEIYCGITKSPLMRIKKLWDDLPSKYHEKIKLLENHFNPTRNFRVYREAFNDAIKNQSPVIPYIVAHVKDLYVADDSNSTLLDNNSINFEKLILIGNILNDILDAQKLPFSSFVPKDEILRYYKNLWWLEDNDLYFYAATLSVEKRKGSTFLNAPSSSSSSQVKSSLPSTLLPSSSSSFLPPPSSSSSSLPSSSTSSFPSSVPKSSSPALARSLFNGSLSFSFLFFSFLFFFLSSSFFSTSLSPFLFSPLPPSPSHLPSLYSLPSPLTSSRPSLFPPSPPPPLTSSPFLPFICFLSFLPSHVNSPFFPSPFPSTTVEGRGRDI